MTPPDPARDPNRREWLARSARWASLAALPTALPLLPGCATAPVFEPPPARPAVQLLRVGQALSFNATNLYNGLVIGSARYEVLASVPGGAATLAVTLPASNTYRIDDSARTGRLVLASLTHVTEEIFHDSAYRFTPPSRWLPDGLALGSSPYESGTYKRDDEFFPLRWQTRVDALGWERIRVPAGEYLTLRVQRRIWFDHPERWRVNNTRTETLWFAPALGFWVRREWTGEYLRQGIRREREVEDWVRFELVTA